MKQKLWKSNVSSHEIKGFHRIQYCLRSTRIDLHAFSIENIWHYDYPGLAPSGECSKNPSNMSMVANIPHVL